MSQSTTNPPPVKRGAEHHNAKLSDAAVREIRRQAGLSRQVFLAARYGVSQPLISQIQAGKMWRHVD